MSIEELVKKYVDATPSLFRVHQRLRAALTEQAAEHDRKQALLLEAHCERVSSLQERIRELEAHAIELRAYEATVEDTVLPIANAYESGIGHCNDNLCNPYKEGSAEAFAYNYGKEFGKTYGISQSVPEGWKLVPIEATQEMLKESGLYDDDTIEVNSAASMAGQIYRAMLAAAPKKEGE